MEYIVVNESELNDRNYSPINAVFLMIRFNNEYLLKREFDGGHWELPAIGPIKANETPRECVLRNYSEKYGLNSSNVKLIGVKEVLFEKTNFRPDPKPEYLALFEADIKNKDDVMQRLDENLHLWYIFGDDVSPYCQLCRRLIEYRNSVI